MNKLFLITCRWLKRDKRRTALTFSSIVLAVYLISFVGVFMSTALSVVHGWVAYNEPAHARISLYDREQAEKLDRNASWDKHMYYSVMNSFMTNDFMRRYGTDKESLFPAVTVNDISIFDGHGVEAAYVSGDSDELLPRSMAAVTGELPREAHEAAVSTEFAARFGGLDIGDSFTIKYEVRKGKLYTASEEEADSENGLTFTEDKTGMKLKQIYAQYQYDSGMYYDIFTELYRVMNGKEPPDRGRYGLPPAYAELSDETVDSFEYTAKVTGFVDSGYGGSLADVFFSPKDKDIMPYFDESPVNYSVRVKSGLDAEKTCKEALAAIRMDDDGNSNLEMNVTLLILEGRQLEYMANIGLYFILAAVIMGLFVFLARLIINNAFEISAAYRTEQYGALKTIGASDRQIFAMIMFECGLYLLTALPVGFALAVAAGRFILSKVQAIAMFDPAYGAGISKEFFSLELSPVVMVFTFGCAAFSIFFSSYADAMRVRRMPPIHSLAYKNNISAGTKKRHWRSRRVLGYARGYAIKCISGQKVRFAVTLVSAVMSGIFVMTYAGITHLYDEQHVDKEDVTEDIIVSTYGGDVTTEESLEAYDKLKNSGLFEDIFIDNFARISMNEHEDENIKYYSEEYISAARKKVYGLTFVSVTRDNFDKYIETDMTYDEFAAGGKPLFSNSFVIEYYGTADRDRVGEKFHVKKDLAKAVEGDFTVNYCLVSESVFNTDDIDELVITSNYSKVTGKGKDSVTEMVPFTEHVACGGLYTSECVNYCASGYELIAILPAESFREGMFEFQKQGFVRNAYGMEPIVGGYSLNVREGCYERALSLLKGLYGEECIADVEVIREGTERKISTIRVAGAGFVISLAAVVLLNLFSTLRANIINRRRDLNMMRSCGMSLKQVRKSLFFEGRIYAGVTMVVSSAGGWVLAYVLYNSIVMQDGFFVELTSILSMFPWYASLMIFAVIMLVTAAAFLPALLAMKKENISEEIRTEI